MFNFFNMMGNHEDRVVDNFSNEDMTIDTCSVEDGKQPYETGIKHYKYKNNNWVIVEAYNTKEEAQIGHDKWVNIMTNEETLPQVLTDCNNAFIADLGNSLFENWPNDFEFQDDEEE